MAFKEVSRVEVIEILRRWQTGVGVRALARGTGLSRNTIRKYIEAAERCGLTRDGPSPTETQLTELVRLNVAGPRLVVRSTEEVLEPWATSIRDWLHRDRLTLTRVHELLKEQRCAVSYMSLYRYAMRREWLTSNRSTVRMADTKPGEMAEMDFGRLGLMVDSETGRRRVVWALIIVLGYSRHSFVWPLMRQQIGDVIEGLEAAWGFFGGMPRYLVLDNFPASVAGPDALNPRLTRAFLEYSQHRGFIADPARVRHPKDKPKVESSVHYVRERFFKGSQFRDLVDVRLRARGWCREVAGARVHGTTRRLPLVVFSEEEHVALLPWDGEPYDVADWHDVAVHPDHHIAYRYALYSVPHHTCPPGTKLEVRGDGKLVRLYHRGILVKVHPRQPRGGRSTDPEDYPKELSSYTLRCPDRLKQQGAELGESVGAFADRLLSGPLPWAKVRQAQKLLRLGERYTSARLDAACCKALTVDLIDVRRLERILIEALETESSPAPGASPALPGRYARPGSAFAHCGDARPSVELIASGNERAVNS
jgi:transposase